MRARIKSQHIQQPGITQISEKDVVSCSIQNFDTSDVNLVLGNIKRILPKAQVVDGTKYPSTFVIDTATYPTQLDLTLELPRVGNVVIDLVIISETKMECHE